MILKESNGRGITEVILRLLLSFNITVKRDILFKTLDMSPMKFRMLLPHCDDIDDLEDTVRDLPAYYYML